MTHLQANDDVIETAALYVLGALPTGDREAFERHLAEGCGVCEGQVSELTPVAADLGHAAPPRTPRPEVRDRLLGRLASARTIARADEGVWERDPLGLEVRRLHRDDDGRVTSLVRMLPGVRYPGHRHASAEELYLLQGDLTVEGERLGIGDYCAAAALTVHGETATAGGCTFVLIASERDEVLSHPVAPSVSRAGLTFVRASEGGWRPGGTPGVETRRLSRDRARGTLTAVVRMAPGARLPRHRHVTTEQLYMLSGDAHIAGEALGPGDYYRATAGTSHDVTHTERGCEFLLISSAVEILD